MIFSSDNFFFCFYRNKSDRWNIRIKSGNEQDFPFCHLNEWDCERIRMYIQKDIWKPKIKANKIIWEEINKEQVVILQYDIDIIYVRNSKWQLLCQVGLLENSYPSIQYQSFIENAFKEDMYLKQM